MNALEQALAPSGSDARPWSKERRRWAANRVLAKVVDYPDQQALVRAIFDGEKNQAAFGTRRSGKSQGVIVAAAALLLLLDNFTVRIMSTLLHSPTANFLARSSDGGLLRMLRDLGMRSPVCKVHRVGVRRSVTAIECPEWGSALYVEDIGSARAIGNKHGFSADLYLVDEATKTPTLEFAFETLVNPTLADTGAIKVFMFTPDEAVDGLPGRIATESFPEWQKHHMRQWRNPHYGATFAERWSRIVRQIVVQSAEEYGLSSDDIDRIRKLSETECDAISLKREAQSMTKWVDSIHPELLRNLFGRWVTYGARLVFPFHRLPPDMLYYCAASERDTHKGQFAVATTMPQRIALLPAYPHEGEYDWRVSLAGDLGMVDAWAGCAKIWNPEHTIIYELETRKETGLDDDQMWGALCDFLSDLQKQLLPSGGRLPISSFVGDFSGGRVATQAAWNARMKKRFPALARTLARTSTTGGQRGLAVRAAKKWEKGPRIKQHNLGMHRGYFRYIAGGILDVEGRHLRYKPDKSNEIDKHREVRLAGGKKAMPGNDGSDAGFYADYEIKVERSKEPDRYQNHSSFFRGGAPS